ncbi:MAG: hypothetical protein RMJ60_04600 [Anaerolineales bacterium]|nr:hypothetical protein [Anaerolineales bacterium]
MAIPAAITSLILGLILFSILSIFVPSLLAGIVAAVLVTPFFLIITLSPLIFLTGMFLVYESIVWTLTYREVQAAEELLSPAIQGEIGNVEA